MSTMPTLSIQLGGFHNKTFEEQVALANELAAYIRAFGLPVVGVSLIASNGNQITMPVGPNWFPK